MARFLGFRNWRSFDELSLIERAEQGLPTKMAHTIAQRIDPSGEKLSAKDIFPPYMLSRRRNDVLPLAQSERLLAVARVLHETLRQCDGQKAAALAFLTRPHEQLGQMAPLDFARRSVTRAVHVVTLLRREGVGPRAG